MLSVNGSPAIREGRELYSVDSIRSVVKIEGHFRRNETRPLDALGTV